MQASAARAFGWPKSGFLRIRRLLITLGMLALVFGVWAAAWDSTDFLPSPSSTIDLGIQLLGDSSTYSDLLATGRRLFVGLGSGYLAGLVATLLMRQAKWWRLFWAPYVFVLISTPSMAASLIALMVFGLSEVGIYVAVAGIIFPFVVVSLFEGLDNLDAKLKDMTKAYGFSNLQRIRHQTIPEMAPYLFAAFRNVHAHAWKVVTIAELFSQQNGIGFQYNQAFAFFEFERLFVWAFFFVAMVSIVEYGILRPFETYVFRWRRTSPRK